MGTPVQIQVVISESGVRGLKSFDSAAKGAFQNAAANVVEFGKANDSVMEKMAATHKDAMSEVAGIHKSTTAQMRAEHHEAHISAHLLTEEFGIHMPRALRNLASESESLGPILRGAFNASVIIGSAMAIYEVAKKIKEAAYELGGFTMEMQKLYDENIKLSRKAFEDAPTAEIARKNVDEIHKRGIAYEQEKKSLEGLIAAKRADVDRPLSQNPEAREEVAKLMERLNELKKTTAADQISENRLLARNTELNIENGKVAVEIAKKRAEGNANRIAGIRQAEAIDIQAARDEALRNKEGLTNNEALQKKETLIHVTAQVEIRKERDKTAKEARRLGDERLRKSEENEKRIRKLDEETVLAQLQGIAKLRKEEGFKRHEVELGAARNAQTDMQVALEQLGIHNHTESEIAKLIKDRNEKAQALGEQTKEKELKGLALIDEQTRVSIAKRIEEFKKLAKASGGFYDDADRAQFEKSLQDQITQISAQGMKQREAMEKKNHEETQKMEEAAAIAGMQPKQRAMAEIMKMYEDQKRSLVEMHRLSELSDKDFATREVLIEQEKNAKILDLNRKMGQQLGSQMESVFDSITSGNIGKTILDQFKHFFFKILGMWMQTMGGMRNSSAGGGAGGGIFGSLLGSLFPGFGGGGSGGVIPGGSAGGGGTPPFFGGSAQAGQSSGFSSPSLPGILSGAGAGSAPSDSGNAFPFGFGNGIGLGTPSFATPPFVNGSNMVSGPSSGFSSPALAGLLSAGAGTADVAQSQANKQKGIAGLFAGIGGGKLAPLAMMAALGLGQKSGGTAGMLGASAAMLSLMIGHGGFAGALGALGIGGGFAASILGPAAGGLLGFGVGYQTGSKTIGGITGAIAGIGTTALTMAMLGLTLGPVGFIVAGLVGLLGGIFGGIFGGKAKKKAAEKIAGQFAPEIAKITDAYKSYQLDHAGAFQQLDDLSKNAYDQMSKYGSQGRGVYHKTVEKEVADAKAQIDKYDAQRTRRSSINFGLPQFALGGFNAFSNMPGGATLSVIHQGEYVVNAPATASNRGLLDQINSGRRAAASSGDQHFHFNINALDGKSFSEYLRNGGLQQLKTAVRSHRLEGGSF